MVNLVEATKNLLGIQKTPPSISPSINDSITSYRSSYYPKSYDYPYNPDDLVKKKGGLAVYEKMMTDEQVKASFKMKINAIIGNGWKIEPANDTPEAKEQSDFIEYCLTDGMEGSFRRNLKDMLTALAYGFSVTEEVYQPLQSGPFSGKIGLRCLLTRPPHTFEFDKMDDGALKELRQNAAKGTVRIDPETISKKFIIYTYDAEFGGEYGQSDLRAAYRSWWSKDIITKFMNIYLERFGTGILVGRYPRGMSGPDQADLEKMIKNITAKTAFKVPDEVKFEVLEGKGSATAIFIPVLEYYNKAISRSVLLPDKLGFTDSEGGSYNLGQNQFNLFFALLDDIRQDFSEAVINEQLICRLCDMNYSAPLYPKFKFNPLTEKDKAAMATTFITAVEKGVIVETEADEEYLRDTIGFVKRDIESPIIERPAPASPFGVVAPSPAPGNDRKEAAGQDDDVKMSDNTKRKPNKYEQSIDFAQEMTDIDKGEQKYKVEIGRQVMRMKDDLLNTIERKKIVDDKDFDAVDKLVLKNLGDLKAIFGDMYRNAFTVGKKHSKDEIKTKRADFAVKGRISNLPPKETLAYFDRKKFTLAGNESDYILKNVKNLLYEGIKSGKGTNEVVYNIEDFFDKNYATINDLPDGTEEIDEIPGRIEAIVRTNYNDAYNQGKLASFQDESVADFIPAYEYSSIIDDRTTSICTGLDGLIYNANDPIWQKIMPPNHFNCRSTIIPILSDEEYEVSEYPSPENMPDPSFGG